MKWPDYKMSEEEERGQEGGRKTSNNNTGLGSGGKLARMAARGFEIWTVVNEGSVASSYTYKHTHIHTPADTHTRWASRD